MTRAAVALALLLAVPAAASDLLWLSAGRGAFSQPAQRRFTAADGILTARWDGQQLTVTLEDFENSFWHVVFTPRTGDTPAAGTYDCDAGDFFRPNDTTCGFSADGPVVPGCPDGSARLVIHRLAYGTGTALTSLSADFREVCPGAPSVSGSVRLRTGDATCVGVPDGTSCDDGDGCTADDRCTNGVCTGTLGASACTATQECHVVPLCDPSTGACAGPLEAPDGSACEDGDACTAGDTCRRGVCESGAPVVCDDHTLCTDDVCDAARGCIYTPLADTCWDVQGTLTDFSCISNFCEREPVPTTGALLLWDDHRFVKRLAQTCGTARQPLPDESGTWVSKRSGRIVMRTTNLRDWAAARQACDADAFGVNVARKGQRTYKQWVETSSHGGTFCKWPPVPADGAHLCGFSRIHATSQAGPPTQRRRVASRREWLYTGTRGRGLRD